MLGRSAYALCTVWWLYREVIITVTVGGVKITLQISLILQYRPSAHVITRGEKYSIFLLVYGMGFLSLERFLL